MEYQVQKNWGLQGQSNFDTFCHSTQLLYYTGYTAATQRDKMSQEPVGYYLFESILEENVWKTFSVFCKPFSVKKSNHLHKLFLPNLQNGKFCR